MTLQEELLQVGVTFNEDLNVTLLNVIWAADFARMYGDRPLEVHALDLADRLKELIGEGCRRNMK